MNKNKSDTRKQPTIIKNKAVSEIYWKNEKNKAVVKLDNISTGYKDKNNKKTVSRGINLRADKGKLIFLTGPNGSGKTTLLKTITGNLKPLNGRVTIAGKEISDLKGHKLSRLISVVLTEIPDPGYLTVEEIISLGRSPYTGFRNSLSDSDRSVIKKSLKTLGLDHLKGRLFSRLSDGEKQKTMIARALCQDTEIICMDEPSSHLDFPSRVELVSFLKTITEKENKTIIVSSHDLNIAINSSDIMWLIDQSGTIHSGSPEDLALSGTVGRVFNRGIFSFSESTGEFIIEKTFKEKIKISGDTIPSLWTEKGFRKLGFSRTEEMTDIHVIIKKQNGSYRWQFGGKIFLSIESLLDYFRGNFL